MGIMTLILMVNNLAQNKLREYLTVTNKVIPSQRGKPTLNPTFKWV